MMNVRRIPLVATLIVAGPAHAFDASNFPMQNFRARGLQSPTYDMPNVDHLVVQSTGGLVGPTPTLNPYAPGAYPSWAYGLGSQYGGYTGYYDVKPLSTSSIYMPKGSATFTNPFTYGGLNTSGTMTVSANVNRPGCVSGYTAPGQSAGYDEFGAYAFCSQLDSVPLMANVEVASFTPTQVVLKVPLALSDTVRIAVGMWVRTNDAPAQFNGQITSWQTNAQGAVTTISVSNWFKRGAGGVPGTPAGTRIFVNPQDKLWNQLNTTFQNGILFKGTTTAGFTGITVDKTDGLYPNGQLVEGPGIPTNSVITGVNPGSSHIFISKAATATGTATLTATAGTEFGKAVGMEMDLFNAGVAFTPTWIVGVTGDTVAGSYTVSNVGNISAWRPGLVIYGATVPAGSIVTSVNYGNNSLTIRNPALATATGISLKAIHQLEEGGTGIDCLGVVKNSNTCYLQRGSVSYGYVSMGAGDTSFLVRPDVFAGQPRFGFRTNAAINGHPTVADFAVTEDDLVLWGIDALGREKVQSVDSATDYKIRGSTVIDYEPWTDYQPTIGCQSGAVQTQGQVTARYKRIGKTVHVNVEDIISAVGSCSGFVSVTMPFVANVDTVVHGRERARGYAVVGLINGANTATILQKYDGTSFLPTDPNSPSGFVISATYEAQ